jgi:hypothetical protein
VTAAAFLLRRMASGPIEVHLGVSAAWTHVRQQDPLGRVLTGTVPGAAGVLALEVPIGHWLAMRFAWEVGAELLPIDGSLDLRPAIRAAVGLGVRR